jgi:hypothetical protein
MAVSKQWQREINMVFEELGKTFDFWTDEFCGFHVHVSPGATSRYTLDQLLRTAKGAYFWEEALCQLLPHSRGWNDYAKPNFTVFGHGEYMSVPNRGWSVVFKKLDGAATSPDRLLGVLKGGETGRGWTENLSHNFCPVNERGTIEFRRQAGVASAMSTIRGILLAVTLYISALRYDFDGASSRSDHPDGEELIRELASCIKKLPETCHGTRFVHWLKWCHGAYNLGKSFTGAQINIREEAFRNGLTPPDQIPYKHNAELPPPGAMELPSYALAPTARDTVPQARQGTTPSAQGRGGVTSGRGGTASGRGGLAASGRGGAAAASGRGGGVSGRGGAGQSSSTLSRAPAPQNGRGGGASGRGGGGQSSSTARPPAASTSDSASAPPTRPPAASRTGGSTTRLPERPAVSSSRPAASSSNTNTTAPASGQRRRREGDANS